MNTSYIRLTSFVLATGYAAVHSTNILIALSLYAAIVNAILCLQETAEIKQGKSSSTFVQKATISIYAFSLVTALSFRTIEQMAGATAVMSIAMVFLWKSHSISRLLDKKFKLGINKSYG